ncbi:MAG: hypothetical protein SF052_19280 [Bacteroidia bacterium]|nr:hypothetical protein [Bacteroidia bacterium]
MKKVLLDENLPKPLVRHFSDRIEASSVHDQGWASKKNGELLAAMTNAAFEYLLTVDRNLEHQQNIDKYPIKIIVVLTYDNRYKTLAPFIPIIEKSILEMPNSEKLIHLDLRGI